MHYPLLFQNQIKYNNKMRYQKKLTFLNFGDLFWLSEVKFQTIISVLLAYQFSVCSIVLCVLLQLSHFSRVRLCATSSLGFSRKENWSGLPFPSPVHKSEKWKWGRWVMSDSSRPQGLQPTRLLCPWDFPGKSTGVGCHCLLCVLCVWGNKCGNESIWNQEW